jgi:YbbR domain-containing protein
MERNKLVGMWLIVFSIFFLITTMFSTNNVSSQQRQSRFTLTETFGRGNIYNVDVVVIDGKEYLVVSGQKGGVSIIKHGD